MTITRVKQLRKYGIFRDFTWPEGLPEFGRYNLIYGWNSSGKTILSRAFHALETKTPPSEGEVVVSVNGRDFVNEEFAQFPIGVRVFNRDYVEESVFHADQDIAPIFVLGKENVKKQKQAEQLRVSHAKALTNRASSWKRKWRAQEDLEKFCILHAKSIKDMLRSGGASRYNDYNTSHFSQRAREMVAAGDGETHRVDTVSRPILWAQHRATRKRKLTPVSYQIPAVTPLGDAVSKLLATTVVSAAIRSLKEDPALASWVHEGVGLHKTRQAEKCLFCDRAMPKARLAALEAHFSSEYDQFLKNVKNQTVEIESLLRDADKLELPVPAELYDDMSSEYTAARAALQTELATSKMALEAWMKALVDKRSRPFESVASDLNIPDLDTGVVDRLNGLINRHNEACNEFQSRINNARTRLEADSVAEALEEFVGLDDKVQESEKELEATTAEIKSLEDKIEELERDILEHRRPAEALNDDLRSYLGHGELRLKFTDPGYTIMRGDTEAKALSEGEKTAIALLYFLKSLESREFNMNEEVVVLDDPVSSLDANSLYSAFGLIQERTKNAAQLIILTHNFTFFRQVRQWFKRAGGRFYMLDCSYKENRRCASIRQLDPLLKDYDSEYHYLFARVYRVAMAPSPESLTQNYVLPNMARRLLETFLAFRQPNTSEGLYRKLKRVAFNEGKKTRILRFIHTYSHSTAVGEPEHDLSLLSETQGILKEMLGLMKSEDEGHFLAMESLVKDSEKEKER